MASEGASDQVVGPEYRLVTIDQEQTEPHGHTIGHPLELLRDIWRNPSIAQSIEYINFADRDGYDFEANQVDDDIKNLIREFESDDGQIFLSYCIRNTPLSRHEALWERCRHGLLSGKRSYAFTILMVILPRLERLRFCRPSWDMELLQSIFTDASFSSNLSTVECYHDDTEDYISVEDFMVFALAPSVRLLRGRTVGEYVDWSKLHDWETATSHLERLELTACAVEEDDLMSLLRPMRNLKELRYYGDYSHLIEGPFETQSWVDALVGAVGPTLEALTLTCEEGSTRPVKTFKIFEKLRELEIDVRSLVRDAEDDISIASDVEDEALETGFHEPSTNNVQNLVPRLVDILPSSIEKVDLFVRGLGDETQLLLRDLVSEKARVPNLRSINLGGFDVEQNIKDELMSVGVVVGRKRDAARPDYVFFWKRDPPLYSQWLVGRPC